ncbi:MAG: hypothetical protein ACE5GX_02805 [Thermoanaerobaculia bacterium]
MMSIRNALIFAALIISFSLALAFAVNLDFIDVATSERAQGVVLGLVLVICANLVPKTLEPLSARCDPSTQQALQRFSGWTLVLAGLGYSLAWLVLPIERARIPAMAIVAVGVVLVAGRLAWALTKRQPARPGADS